MGIFFFSFACRRGYRVCCCRQEIYLAATINIFRTKNLSENECSPWRTVRGQAEIEEIKKKKEEERNQYIRAVVQHIRFRTNNNNTSCILCDNSISP